MQISKIIAWAGFSGAVLTFMALAVLQFMNPDMTRARLVITYWPVLAGTFICILVAVTGEFLSNRGKSCR